MELLRRLHRWVGLALGLVLGVVAASGGALLFRDDYQRARFPRLAAPATEAERTRRGDVLEAVFAEFPEADVRVVRLPTAALNGFEVSARDGRRALFDPETGEVLDRWTWRDDGAAFLFELHAHLLAGEIGHTLNGVVGVAGVFFVASGIVLWWPGRSGAYRWTRVVPRRASGADLLRSHAATGFLVAVPLALFAVTGTALVFHKPVATLVAPLDAQPRLEPKAVVPAQGRARRPWAEILRAADGAMGDGELVMLLPPRKDDAAVTFRKRLPGEWHPNGRSLVRVDPSTARVVETIDARAQGAGTRLTYAVYPVHAARGIGRVLLVPALIAAVGTTWLAVGGMWAWFRRRPRALAVPTEDAPPLGETAADGV